MTRRIAAAAMALIPLAAPAGLAEVTPAARADAYASAIRKINEEHAKKPASTTEPDLGKRLPKEARASLDGLLEAAPGPALVEPLATAGEAALDLDLAQDFKRIQERLRKASPEAARKLGVALSRPRFILRGQDGLELPFLESFADVLDAILDAYDDVFGFEEWSKVPGKKLRVRVHLVAAITKPPHFDPGPPFHSEIDFPVADATELRSPTADGKFLFYGLCHELGHVIAMWGDPQREEDHHAWAHYTGVVIVEHLSKKRDRRAPEAELRDVKWRSLEAERKAAEKTKPSLADKDGVLALLIALHDKVGPKALGEALNLLDRKDQRRRVNRVRYYTFKELREALLKSVDSPAARNVVTRLLP